MANAATTNQLINGGLLCNYRIYSASSPDLTGVPLTKAGEYVEREAERRVLPIVGDAVAEYVRRGADRKFIAFAVSVAHAKEIQRQFMAAGIVTTLCTYQQTGAERKASIDEFRKPDSFIRGLISIESLTRGFDVADVGVLILARPLRKSLAVHLQMIGRVLRTAPGKEQAVILDHAANCARFWGEMCDFFEHGVRELDDGKKREKRKATPKDREPFKCPNCSHLHDPKPACPSCGHEYPVRSQIIHLAGELRELGSRPGASADEKQEMYSMLLHVAFLRGHSSGWVAHRYRERFGVWPRLMRDVLRELTPQVLNWIRSRAIAHAKRRAA